MSQAHDTYLIDGVYECIKKKKLLKCNWKSILCLSKRINEYSIN